MNTREKNGRGCSLFITPTYLLLLLRPRALCLLPASAAGVETGVQATPPQSTPVREEGETDQERVLSICSIARL